MSKPLDADQNINDKTLSWVQRYYEPTLPSERVKIMDKLVSNEPLEVVLSVHKQISKDLVQDLKQLRQSLLKQPAA